MKKVMVVLLCMSLLVTSFTGCSTKEDTETESSAQTDESADSTAKSSTTEEPMEISIAIWDIESALSDPNDKVLQTLEEKLSIDIVPVNITWSDYEQKAQLWAASGSLPDITAVDVRNSSNYSDWAEQGVIKALPEDLSAYPNLEKYLQLDEIQANKIDGKLYCIPRKTYGEQSQSATDRMIAYRWDLAQAAGVTKEPETWDEFRDMIQKIIVADPEGKQISGMTAYNCGLLPGLLFTYSLPLASDNAIRWVEQDGQYIPAYFANDPIPTFQLARDMYAEGTIEKDISLTTIEQSADKFLQGQSAAIAFSGQFQGFYTRVGQYWSDTHEGRKLLDDVKVLDLMPGVDGTTTYPVWSIAWSESIINSNVNDEKMAKILELYEYLLSDEGSFMVTNGFEGEDYDLVDGNIVLKEGIEIAKKYPSTAALGVLARWTPSTYDSRYPASVPSEYVALDEERAQEASKLEIPEHDLRYTFIRTPLRNDFSTTSADDLLLVMTGTDPVEDMWAEILKKYEDKGLWDVVKEVNEKAKELGY